MRLTALHLIVTLVTGFGIGASSLQAADPPKGNPEGRSTSGDRPDRVKAVTDELKLTPEQQEKLRPILTEEGRKMRAIFQDVKLSRDEKMAKMKESRVALRDKLKVILTPAQLEKWDKLTAQRTQRSTRATN